MEALRVGILGCGSWGPQICQALMESRQVKLVAAADLDLERAQAVAAAAGGAKALTDAEGLCRLSEVEAVIVAAPTPAHCALTCMALQAGKHVLVEKPIAPTLAEAQTMLSAAEKAGRRLMVGQIMRFLPAAQEFRRRISAGDIGRPLHVIEQRYGAFRVHAWPDWWKKMDGFLLLHLGSHSVDMILWSLGRRAEWAFAQGMARKVDPTHGAIDTFSLTLGLEGEVLAGLHHEATGGAAHLAYHLLAVGESGRLELDEFTTVRLNGVEVFRQAEEPFQPALRAEVDELASAVREDRQPSVSAVDVLPVVACLDAARRSLHSRQMEAVACASRA